MKTVYLSRRNLEALLSKLDRVKAGDASACSIIKRKNPDDGIYMTTIDAIMVTAVEDELLYANRSAGMMNPADVKEVRHTSGECFTGPLI